jgi:hypothetical protein
MKKISMLKPIRGAGQSLTTLGKTPYTALARNYE